jgi:hypothetical protein
MLQCKYYLCKFYVENRLLERQLKYKTWREQGCLQNRRSRLTAEATAEIEHQTSGNNHCSDVIARFRQIIEDNINLRSIKAD